MVANLLQILQIDMRKPLRNTTDCEMACSKNLQKLDWLLSDSEAQDEPYLSESL